VTALEAARKVADAVLYEGYVLYPYRASARKNRLRWQFGVLAPRPHCEAEGGEAWSMRTECLLEVAPGVGAGARAEVEITVRFLRLRTRRAEGREPWDEGVEEQVVTGWLPVAELLAGSREVPFDLPAAAPPGPGQQAVAGVVRVSARLVEGPHRLVRLRVDTENGTPWHVPGAARDEVMRRSLVGVHALLAVREGAFLSLLDPPEWARGPARACINRGTWPVLVGAEGERSVVLSSPITLYDYPQVAPESAGDFFDATEIDEMLALRVMTLTDVEKAEARATDPRAAAIVDRCETIGPELMDRLHGAVRQLREAGADAVPWWDPGADRSVDPSTDTVRIGSVDVGRGTKVRLRPGQRADAQDLFLDGLDATVQGVFHDVDGDVHLAVTIDDDPAAEFDEWYGRYRYFRPDEVVPR
jgi:hypothetical protein